MDTKGPETDPAALGVAAELFKVWQTLLKALGPFGEVLGIGAKPPFDVVAIRMTRIEITESGEKMVAPVRFEDLRPATGLFMDMSVDVQGKLVSVLSQVYINEQLAPDIMFTEIPEFEILPEDVKDDTLSEAVIERMRELLESFPVFTSAFLGVLVHTHSRQKNEEKKG